LNFRLDIKSKTLAGINVAAGTFSKNDKPSPFNSPTLTSKKTEDKTFLKYVVKRYPNTNKNINL
jgi:hypothetical protein